MSLEIHFNVGGCFNEPARDIELCKEAADAGFDGIWVGDHFHPWLDNRPFTHHVQPWLGALMNEVDDITVGTSVSCPIIRYEPPVFAQAIATLDNMFPGRFELGVGVGEALNEAPFYDGEWPSWGTRAEMLVEAIDIMRQLWTADDYISYDGNQYEYPDLKVFTKPKTDIDVHWAAWGPRSSQLAGEHADHVITAAGPDLIENQVHPNFRKGRDAVGKSGDDYHVSNELSAAIGDPDELVAEVRERGELIPADSELNTRDPRAIQQVANDRLAEMSDREIQDAFLLTDDPGDIVEAFEGFEDVGVTRVLVTINVGDQSRAIQAFGDSVIPEF
ncbi:MAG: LLM class flavin-dependent oxidoreductase [Natronomonas sp.]|uniref:LLM class flavin-dependent oxidoreductase n=1 Tax=Natronomonas sp. TaxID=2184060 RepID=UPI002870A4E1|nr:LLM class flavin-dependent oxidoreductase [Natronomonas sp.]MDR9431397.1 LLM class flavin-dependent oxidoreductase [Natronomonas sp.]